VVLRRTIPLLAILFFLTLLAAHFILSGGENPREKSSKGGVSSGPAQTLPELVRRLEEDFRFQYSLFKRAEEENGKFVYRYGGRFVIYFSPEPDFQRGVEEIFKRYKVKYGAYVAVEPSTGRVLAACSSLDYPDLALKNSYPTASTFKIITAAAALELGIATPSTKLTCGGVGDSCSPSVWLNSKLQIEREFAKSFATSANPFFGNLGRLLGKEALLEYAEKFGFNSKLYNFPWGVVREPLDDYELALLAAGLGDSRTSPFHQAYIAQVIVGGGTMLKPTLVEKVVDLLTGNVYRFAPETVRKVISEETAREIREMMVLTTQIGTLSNKRYFRRLRRLYPELIIGGKSGTLSEKSYPEGRCEWLTGFFEYNGERVAFSSVAVNGRLFHITGYEIGAAAAEIFVKLLKRGR